MSTIIEAPSSGSIVDLGVADKVIEGYEGRLADLQADTPAGYQAVRAGILELTKLRTGVESSRKELKASALDYGRKVDAEAKRVTALIRMIEDPLKQRKLAVDNEVALAKKEAEDAKRAEQEAIAKAEKEARDKADRLERERIAKEQAKERAALAKEREEAKQVREKLEAQQRKIDQERAEIEAEKRKVVEAAEKVERDRLAEIERAKQEKAVAVAEVKRKKAEKAAEKKRIADEADAEKERLRLVEERKPDVEKLHDFAERIMSVDGPILKSEWAKNILGEADEMIVSVHAFVINEIDGEHE